MVFVAFIGAFRVEVPIPVSAHAVLLRTDPPDICGALQTRQYSERDSHCGAGVILAAAPATVRLRFSTAAQPVGVSGGIRVTAPSGQSVTTGPVQIAGGELSVPISGDETGTYTVRWEVISDDTHPERGQFAFSVGQPSDSMAIPTNTASGIPLLGLTMQVAAHWLHFVGYALGFGPLAFGLFVAPVTSVRIFADGDPAAWRVRKLIQVGIVLLLLAEPLALVGQVVSLGAGGTIDVRLVGDVLASNFGRVLAQRLGAAALLWTLLGVLDETARRGVVARVALALGVALAVADGEASHAGNGGMAWLGFVANAVHVGAMGLWLGGLVTLVALWGALGGMSAREAAVRRFGRLAAVALILLVVSGTMLAARNLPQLADLFTSTYGRALIAKLMVLLDVLLLAVAATGLGGRDTYRWWMLEGAAIGGVLVFAAVLVSISPP